MHDRVRPRYFYVFRYVRCVFVICPFVGVKLSKNTQINNISEVFTELLVDMGVQNVVVKEMYTLGMSKKHIRLKAQIHTEEIA